VTSRIRVGSGGVMLPNHAPLVVAERFKMLEALFPAGSISGSAARRGTDGATAHALRSRLDRREGDDFLERLHELTLWETAIFRPAIPTTMWWRCPTIPRCADLAAWLQRLQFRACSAGRHGFRVRASLCVL